MEESHGWRWVVEGFCRQLRRQDRLEGVVIPDTVLFENGVPTVWLYCQDDELLSRHAKWCSLDNIRRKFRAFGFRTLSVVFQDGSRERWSHARLKEAKGVEKLVSVQPYITPKGVNEEDSTRTIIHGQYRQEVRIHSDGRVQVNSLRLEAPTSTGENGELIRESIRSRNVQVNERMKAVSLAVIKHIEAAYRCRVTSIVADYVVDSMDKVWLLGVSSADSFTEEIAVFAPTVAIDPPSHYLERKLHNEESEEKQAIFAAEEEMAIRDLGLPSDAGAMEIAEAALARTDRRNHSPTRKRRLDRVQSPARSTSNRKKSSSNAGWMPSRMHGRSASPTSDQRRQRFTVEEALSQNGLRNKSSIPLFDSFDPLAAIGENLERGAHALQSSQKQVCPGDFCGIPIDLEAGDDASVPTEVTKYQNFISNAQQRRVGSPKRQSTAGENAAEEGEGVAEDTIERPTSPPPASRQELTHTVSYKAILQARAEHRLVELLIKRVKKKESGDYVQSFADLESSEVGKVYPAHYYQQTRVCANCFKLYSKIEDSRQRALAKMDEKYPEMVRRLKEIRSKEEAKQENLNRGIVERRVHPYSEPGKKLMQMSFDELRQIAASRATDAIHALSKADLAEFRSFQNPPPRVIQVSQALMLLLTGKFLTWEATKRVMANGERFMAMLLDADPECVPPQRITDLEPFVNDPSFRPNNLLKICKSAACFCEYVIGVVQAHKYKAGTAHPRSDPLLFLDLEDAHQALTAKQEEEAKLHDHVQVEENEGLFVTPEGSFLVTLPKHLQEQAKKSKYLKVLQQSSGTAAPLELKLEQQRQEIVGKKRPNSAGDDPRTEVDTNGNDRRPASGSANSIDTVFSQQEAKHQDPRPQVCELNLVNIPDEEYHGKGSPLLSPKGLSVAQHRSMAGSQVGFNRHESIQTMQRGQKGTASSPALPTRGFADSDEAVRFLKRRLRENGSETHPEQVEERKLTKRERRARRRVQQKQMERLHAGGNMQGKNGGEESSTAVHALGKSFQCSDGVTVIPYEVIGPGGIEGSTPNLIVVHDIFDTFEAVQIFLEPVMRKYRDSQALVFNYPGQAFTRFPNESTNVLNNAYCAATLHELLVHLETESDFCCSIRPFYLLGIGNGANIAAFFASEYGSLPEYSKMFRGLVSVNGFSHVDEQLAAILHSSVNVFSCFPPTRPDLPISYFTRFLFSDDYLNNIDPTLVLNIYTAVGNPITLQGRIQLCNGALKHKDVSKKLKEIGVPVVVVQSTENILVNPTNVDPFIDGRAVSHLWSHQLSSSGKLGSKATEQLGEALGKPNGAFVVWLKAGHEVRQESKTHILSIIEALFQDQSSLPRPKRETRAPKVGTEHDKKKASVSSPAEETEVPLQPETSMKSSTSDKHVKNRTSRVTAKPGKKPRSSHTAAVESKTPHSNKSSGERMEVETEDQQDEDVNCEFEKAMKRHKEAKRQAEELRRQRLAELEKKAQEEERLYRQERDTLEKERLAWEEQKAKQFELEMEERKRLQEAKLQENLSFEKQQLLDDVEKERVRAKELSEKLEAELDQVRKQKEEHRRRAVEAEKEMKRVTEERLRKSTQENGLDYDKIVAATANAKDRALTEQDRDAKKEEEVRRQIELLRKEQEERRRKWEEEDRLRIAALEAKLLGQPLKLPDTPAPQVDSSEYIIEDTPPPKQVSPQQQESGPQEKKVISIKSASPQPETKSKLDLSEYEQVRREMEHAEEERIASEQGKKDVERFKLETAQAKKIQAAYRGRLGRKRFKKVSADKRQKDAKYIAATKLQALQRGRMGRERAEEMRGVLLREKEELEAARTIQRVARGMFGRRKAMLQRRERAAREIQRHVRGFLGCCKAYRIRMERVRAEQEGKSATKIQSVWRMFFSREAYLQQRILELAATQIQRVYRGCRGRRKAHRKRTWENAEPGPERLQLGLSLIEESKAAFSAQQEEIDALHRAQERAETRVSKIHAGLKESEKELALLEQELLDVDQLDQALHHLTHEKALLEARAEAEERTAKVKGGSKDGDSAEENARRRAAEAYALEMQIHIKRAERERKKKELEAEFAAVFQDIEMKKSELRHLEDSIQDMESTRKRKEREFQRLQRNLMELLEEQKNELDNLRERGIELEAATATSAAAAAATAAAAKENEERSRAMFNSTEELLKFQFMSMSLSYFSSMNMLKSLRDINADTTQAAISSTADTAAAAAAAAAAANIPSVSGMQLGSQTSVGSGDLKAKEKELHQRKEVEEAKRQLEQPFGNDVRKWTVQDVGRWLDTLSLGQYKSAFAEACIDGEFLMEIRVEDMRDVLGMKHALHVQKLDNARNKLRPLSEQERLKKEAVEREERIDATRGDVLKQAEKDLIPDVDTVFSQIRNGRVGRVEKALELGFNANMTDSHGNTGLIVACQNLSKRIADLFLSHGCNINHQNTQGNTALHYAMAYDPEGSLGEFLITKGADDTIENAHFLSPYDGLE